MTIFLNLRTASTGGAVAAGFPFVEGNGLVDRLAMSPIAPEEVVRRSEGRDILFAVHGFNVDRKKGIHLYSRLEQALQGLESTALMIGVLWPGDFWIPAVNYPWEFSDAVTCGNRVAQFVKAHLDGKNIAFVSHSLGARVVLQALKTLPDRPTIPAAMGAAAVDDNCLSTQQYQSVLSDKSRIGVLASRKDQVLRVAYRLGDWVSDAILGDDDAPGNQALGYHGPRPRDGRIDYGQINPTANNGLGYGHNDYFPSPDLKVGDGAAGNSIRFLYEALRGAQHSSNPADWT